MLLPNEGVKLLFKHSSSIINIFHFDFNNQNHFLSLSDNSEIIEFLFLSEEQRILELEKFYIKRPHDSLLEKNGHKVINLKHKQYHKITQVLQFENYIILGYDDGVILVYQVIRKQFEKKAIITNEKPDDKLIMNEKEENKFKLYDLSENEDEEEEEDKDNEENLKNQKDLNDKIIEQNENNNNQNKSGENDDKNKIDYFNSFSLYYILLGHTEEIISLCYIPQAQILISSSVDYTVKIFDFKTGHLTHFFKFDFVINKILYEVITKASTTKIVLTLLSTSPLKVIIDLSANPVTCNTYHFEILDILQMEKINDKYFCLKNNNIQILDKNLEHEGTLISLSDKINFLYFNKYKNDFFIVDNENMVRRVKFEIKQKNKNKDKDKNKNDKNKKKVEKNEEDEENQEKIYESIIKTEFKFKVGEDNIIGFFYFNNFIFVFCRDGNLYLVNFEKIIENYENYLMSIEDAESLKMMETLAKSKKSKKSKKDKGKKTKKKKK